MALEYAREASWDYSVTDLAKAIGMARSSYYKWFERREFRQWWRHEWERYFVLRMARLWGRIFAAACGDKNNASATHARLIIERFDGGAPAGTGEAEQPLKTYVNVTMADVTGKTDE